MLLIENDNQRLNENKTQLKGSVTTARVNDCHDLAADFENALAHVNEQLEENEELYDRLICETLNKS